MIEINLIASKKKFQMPQILGMDLNNLNKKMLVIAFLLTYVPDMFIYGGWRAELEKGKEDIVLVQQREKKMRQEVKKNEGVKNQLEEFNRKVDELKKREKLIEDIAKVKANPMKFMLHLAKTMPKNLWLAELEFTTDKKIRLIGYSIGYKSIGNFIQQANESIFFKRSLRLKKTDAVDGKEVNMPNQRIEKFEISGMIDRFE